MENYISLLLALLSHLSLVDKKQAEKITKELRESTIPSTFKEAETLVKTIFDKIENK